MVDPDLCKGMTLAFFHSVINLPFCKDLFIMEVRGLEIIGAANSSFLTKNSDAPFEKLK